MSSTQPVVVVTGAGHGIERATALLFAAQGARLVLGDINEDLLDESAKECTSAGAPVWVQPYDQRERTSVEALLRGGVEHFGRIDTVANIAGIYPIATVADTT